MEIKKAVNFFNNYIWEAEKKFTGFKKFLIKEIQIHYTALKLFWENDALGKASSMAFTALISLVPFLAVIFMVFKNFGGKDLVDNHVKPYIYEFLAAGTGDKISDYIDKFLDSATVETLGSLGIIFLLISVYSILSSIEYTFNEIWNVKNQRSHFDRLKNYIMIVVLAPILFTISIVLTAKLEAVIEANVPWFSTFIIFQVLPFLLIMISFTLIIITIPNTRVKVRYSLIGAVYGTALYLVSKYLFVHYTQLAVSTNVIYGSLAVLPFLMLWIYFFWIIVIFSVQISYVRQNIDRLNPSKNSKEKNRKDNLSVAFSVMLEFISIFKNEKRAVSLSEIENISIEKYDIDKSIEFFIKSGLISQVDEDESYLPAKPLSDITLKSVSDAVDKMYLQNVINYPEKTKNILDKIITDDYIINNSDMTVEELLEKQAE